MTLRSFGTHNLHDTAGVPTFFADAILFTEAIPPTIRAKVRARRARLTARLSGYTIRVCRDQRDLVVALRRRHYRVTGVRYHRAHPGRAKVTPHRGTFAVETVERATGRLVVFIVEHRINAAFPPYVRGEGQFRAERWMDHKALTLHMVVEYIAAGYEVRAGGDPNANARHGSKSRAYSGVALHEFGSGFDRLASSTPIRQGEVLSRKGSDHPRLRALA